MKTVDSLDLVCTWAIMKSATWVTPLSTDLGSTRFSTLKNAEINDYRGPENLYNTEVKYVTTYEQSFYCCNFLKVQFIYVFGDLYIIICMSQ
jgi:hypothetical protein